jgi:hypothetical protein
MKVLMLEPAGDRVAFDVTRDQAARMVLKRQAQWIPGAKDRIARLASYGQKHPCRTKVSRGGILAAIGRSQVYTRMESAPEGSIEVKRVPTFEYKTIYAEDRNYFNVATTMRIVETK